MPLITRKGKGTTLTHDELDGNLLYLDGKSSSGDDHGALSGLEDDDHPQYFNEERGDNRYIKVVDGVVTDHSNLTGLAEDDHPQYLNKERGDALYAKIDDAGGGFQLVGNVEPDENPNGNTDYDEFLENEGNALFDPASGALWVSDGDNWVNIGSLGQFVLKAGDTMTGSLVIEDSLSVSADVTSGTLKLGSSAKVSSVLNEDDMISDSVVALATQKSIKAYVDNKIIEAKEYKTGLWSPMFSVEGTGDNTINHGTSLGSFTRIGNMIYAKFSISTSSVVLGSTGNIVINNLPYTVDNDDGGGCVFSYADGWAIDVPHFGKARPNSKIIDLYKSSMNGTAIRLKNTSLSTSLGNDLIGVAIYSTDEQA